MYTLILLQHIGLSPQWGRKWGRGKLGNKERKKKCCKCHSRHVIHRTSPIRRASQLPSETVIKFLPASFPHESSSPGNFCVTI